LSAGYWERVGREAAMRRAATPDTSDLDRRLREQNELIAPPGPREGSTAYNRGGKVGQHCYSTGGKVLSCKKF